MKNSDDITQLQNHFRDLADKSYKQDCFTFSDFLSLSEQDAFYRIERELHHTTPRCFGGYEGAERVLVRFGNEESLGYSVDFPICCIHIAPLMEKFADNLSHRDFLGALMNLGIERRVLGDIKSGDKQAYLFCLDTMADFICENLTQVKHTKVKCNIVTSPAELPVDTPETACIQVSSARVDAIIAKVCNLSRSESLDLFREGKVFVNGRLCENNSKSIEIGDVVNARGYGKFSIASEPVLTKKCKISINVSVYK